MTVPVEWSPPNPVLWRLANVVAAPILILLSIPIQFLRSQDYGLFLPESLIILGSTVLLGTALGMIVLLRREALEPAILVLLLLFFTFSRPELAAPVGRLQTILIPLVGLPAAGTIVIVALVLAMATAFWILRGHISILVATVFGVVSLSTLVLPVSGQSSPTQFGSIAKTFAQEKPPVVHIILDEHIGLAGLPTDVPGVESAADSIVAALEDFEIYEKAYSRFAQTQYSLASLMNGDVGRDAAGLVEPGEAGYQFAFTTNKWFGKLKKDGYAISVYQSRWLNMCDDSVSSCYTYPISFNPLQRANIPTLARLRVLLVAMLKGTETWSIAPIAATEALNKFQADIAVSPRGVAYILHLLLPHYGYLYQDDCSIADPVEWDDVGDRRFAVMNTAAERQAAYRRYFLQVTCTARRMANLFAHLKRLGVYDEATIIIHGDHGARIAEHRFRHVDASALSERDLLDQFSTLLAVKRPGGHGRRETSPVAIQAYFGADFLQTEPGEWTTSATVFMRQLDASFGSRELHWR